MKKSLVFIFCFILIFSLTFVSAGLFENFWKKITGKVAESQDSGNELFSEGVDDFEEDVSESEIRKSVEKEKVEEEIQNIDNIYFDEFQYISEDGIIMQRNSNYENIPKYKGYLVEFEGDPIAVKKKELEEKIEKKENNFFFRIFGKAIFTGNSVQRDLDQYKKELRENNEKIKQRIINKFLEQGEAIEIKREYNVLFNGIYLDISDSEAKLVEDVEGVKRVSPNYEVKTNLMDSVPLINADDVWKLNKDLGRCSQTPQRDNGGGQVVGGECLTGKGISIAILDTGIDYTHNDLGGCFGENCKVVDGWDFVNEDSDPMDDHGHGTHCAGIAAGKGVLNGVAPDASLYAYKVLNEYGSGYWDWIIAGIERAVDPNQDGNFEDHVDVMSLSLGGPGNPDDVMSLIIDNAVGVGSVAVIAAGNDGPSYKTIMSPGTSRKAITVGASDKQDQIASFSSRGPIIWENEEGELKSLIKPDVIAPGVDICSSQWENAWQSNQCLDDEHTAISGTSMATPHVAGAVALLIQKNIDWNPDEIKMALRNTAIDIGEDFETQGQGRIDVLDAIYIEEKSMSARLNEVDFFPNVSFDIFGTAMGENFDYYEVYYSEKENVSWNLICQGDEEVEDDVLCESFNVDNLIDGVYYVKLVVYDSQGGFSEDYGVFIKSNSFVPLEGAYRTLSFFGKINLEDINQDGKKEIFVSSLSGKVFGLNKDGSQLQNWPLIIESPAESPLAIIDFEGDGEKDFIVPSSHPYINPKLYRFDSQGNKIWEKEFNDPGIVGCVTLTDLDNDGFSEILTSHNIVNTSGIYGTLYVLDKDGNELWHKQFEESLSRGGGQFVDCISAINLLGDDKKEIVFFTYDRINWTSSIVVLGEGGNLLKKDTYEQVVIDDSSNLVSYDKDFFQETLYALSFYTNGTFYTNIYKINGSSGNITINLFKSFEDFASPSLAIGKFGDGNFLLKGAEWNPGWIGKLIIINEEGQIIKEVLLSKREIGVPLLADVNNDGVSDIFLKEIVLDGSSLEILETPVTNYGYFKFLGSAIGDLDNEGVPEFILLSEVGLFIWELEDFVSPAIFDWPQFQHDPRHTGNYHACPDGTLPNQCSYPKPLYCIDRVFVNNCQECGCSQGLSCVANGKCVNMIAVNGSVNQR